MSLPNSLGFCNYCGQERSAGTSLFKCSRCHGVLYCDREHQKSDWPRHKLLCTQINGNNRNSHNAPTTVEILKPSDSLSTTTSHVMNNVSDSLTVPTGLRKSSSQHLLQDEMLSSVTTKSSPKIYEIQPVQPVFYVVTNPDLLATPNTSGIAVNCPVTASQGNPKFSSSWSDSTLMGASGSVRRNFLREVSSFPTRISHPTKFSHSENLPLNLLSLQCCESETVNSIRVKTSVRHVAQSLTRFGWSVMDNFLGDYHGNRLLTEIAKLYDVGKFSDGQLMRFREGSSAKQIRSDKIMWWDGRKEDSPEIHFLVTMMDAVIVGCSPSLTQCRISGRSRVRLSSMSLLSYLANLSLLFRL